MTDGSNQVTLREAAGPVIEAYVDGSCLDNGSDDAVGGVGCVTTVSGTYKFEEIGRQISYEQRTTSTIAEYAAVIAALARIEDKYSTDVVVHINSDSEAVVRQLQGTYRVRKDSLEEPHRETQEFLNEFQEWRIGHLSEDESRHIRRADELAEAAARGESL